MTRDSRPGQPRPFDPVGLIGQVASLLNTGFGAEETVARVAETLRRGLGAESVVVWLREPNAATLRAIGAPPRASRSVAILPEVEGSNLRLPLLHEGERLGTLEVSPAPDEEVSGAVLPIVANILAPFLASIELSEDLAYEVALRSREIEEQRRFITHVVDSLPVGLYVVDREYRIQIWNRKRELGTQGLRRDEVVGRPVFEVLTRQNATQMRQEFDEVFATGQPRQLEIEVDVGPDTKYYRISKIPMREEGRGISHVLTLGEDVTEAHVTQQRIMQSEKLAAIGQLAAGVMHEINNPLATIGACVQAIHNRAEDAFRPEDRAKLEEYLDIIDKEVQRCERIVDGLLDFSRPKSRVKRAVNLGHLLEDTLFLLKHHERFRKIEVRREIDDTLPPVLANPEQLIQVFMALMLNAMDAMDEGGAMTVRTNMGAVNGDEVEVQIEDTGHGIPRHELAKIFEPFYTTKPQGRGTGLGLSICYGIVAEHRGRIEVDSLAGHGSLFRVFLPITSTPVSVPDGGVGELP